MTPGRDSNTNSAREHGVSEGERYLLCLGRSVHQKSHTHGHLVALPVHAWPRAEAKPPGEGVGDGGGLADTEPRFEDVRCVGSGVEERGGEVGDRRSGADKPCFARCLEACFCVCVFPCFSGSADARFRLAGEARERRAMHHSASEEGVVDALTERGIPRRHLDRVARFREAVPDGDQSLPDMGVRGEVRVEGEDELLLIRPAEPLEFVDDSPPLP